MSRVQVNANLGAEALRTVAGPKMQAVQVAADPRRSSAFQLAEALGATSVQQGLADLQKRTEESAVREATADFNAMTVDQALKLRREKGQLRSSNPLYVATVDHLTGEAGLNKILNETVQKINRGELSFNSEQELDEYLTGQRNEFLSGLSDYAVAGFDKKYGGAKQQLFNINNKALDSKFIEHGNQAAVDAFNTVLDENKKQGLSATDSAKNILKRYDLLSSSEVLDTAASQGEGSSGSLVTPLQQKEALRGVLATLASDGDTEGVAALLNSKLPRNGPTVRALMGQLDALQLEKSAEGVFDRNMRQSTDDGLRPFREQANKGELDEAKFDAYWKPLEKYIGSDTIEAIRQRSLTVRAGKIREIEALDADLIKKREDAFAVSSVAEQLASKNPRPVQDIPTPSGRVIKAQDIGPAAIAKMIESNPNLAPQEIIRRYALGGIENPQWKKEFSTALFNLGEVNIEANGKPVGQLMPATVEALDKFALVRQVSDDYARYLAGGEQNYERLMHIQALREEGIGDTNLAAALVNQKARRNLPPKVWGNIQDSVSSELEKVTNPGFFTGRFWGEVFRLEMGDAEKNVLPIKNSIRSLAETYLAAGAANSGEQAVKMAADYFARPEVTTQINNTLYLNKDLPDLPQGVDKAKWFGAAMEGVVGEKLKGVGIGFNAGDLTLIPQSGGNAPYMISLRGQPTGMYVTKKELKDWVQAEIDKEDVRLISGQNTPKNFAAFSKRVRADYLKKNPSTVFGSGVAQQAALNQIANKDSYEYLKSINALDKSYDEMRDLLSKRKR